MFGGKAVVVILDRDSEAPDRARYEYRLLATKKTSTLQKEVVEAGEQGVGFRPDDRRGYGDWPCGSRRDPAPKGAVVHARALLAFVRALSLLSAFLAHSTPLAHAPGDPAITLFPGFLDSPEAPKPPGGWRTGCDLSRARPERPDARRERRIPAIDPKRLGGILERTKAPDRHHTSPGSPNFCFSAAASALSIARTVCLFNRKRV